MKTSIIISSFAALFLVFNFSEVPSRQNVDNSTGLSINTIKYLPVTEICATALNKNTASTTKEAPAKKTESLIDDFNYLKFDVADYIPANADYENEISTSVVTPENTFDYQKFDVNKYIDSKDATPVEMIEMPENDFDYLKFDVNSFISKSDMNDVEINNAPENEFNYLKFNANNYINENDYCNTEITEQPVDDYSYLKFDARKYATQDTSNSVNIGDLPMSE